MLMKTINYLQPKQISTTEGVSDFSDFIIHSKDIAYVSSDPSPDGKILWASESIEKLFGYKREELLELRARDLYLNKEQRQQIIAEWANSAEDTHSTIVAMRKKSGETIYVRLIGHPHGSSKIMQFGIIDVTERIQFEQQLICVRNILRNINPDKPPQEVYALIHQEIKKILPPHTADNFMIAAYSPTRNFVDYLYYSDSHDQVTPQGHTLGNGGLTDWVITHKKPRIWTNEQNCKDIKPPRGGACARMAIPLILNNKEIVVFILQTYDPTIAYTRKIMAIVEKNVADIAVQLPIYERLRSSLHIIDAPDSPFMMVKIQDGKIVECNKKGLSTIGQTLQELIGKDFTEWFAPEERDIIKEKYLQHIQGNASERHYITKLITKRGEKIPIEVHVLTEEIFNGRPAITAISIDISEIERLNLETEHQKKLILEAKKQDPLTMLLNANAFNVAINNHLALANPDPQMIAGVFLLDIDHFRKINLNTVDYGREFGDELLIAVAERLTNCLRKNKNRETDIIARISADNFGIFFPDIDGQAAVIAKRIYAEMHKPFSIQGKNISITMRIGISFAPTHGGTAEILLQQAEAALLHAKKQRLEYAIITDEIQIQFLQQITDEKELEAAIFNKEFETWYQPKFDRHGKIVGMEALSRWNSPRRGLIGPGKYIQILEETGLIKAHALIMLDNVCRFIKKQNLHLRPDFCVAINISPQELENTQIIEVLTTMLNKYALPASCLELEVTESTIMDNAQDFNHTALAIVSQLRELNFKISIDDFGTGTSSLAKLQELPADKIKLDKAFIDKLSTQKGKDFLRAIINVAVTGIGNNVAFTGEGIETKEQAEYFFGEEFKDINIELQGFHFSKPLPEKQLRKLLAQNSPRGLL